MSLYNIKKRYRLQSNSCNELETNNNTSSNLKNYCESSYPPSPTTSVVSSCSSSQEDLHDLDANWKQHQQFGNGYINFNKDSRTSSPQGHPLTAMVSLSLVRMYLIDLYKTKHIGRYFSNQYQIYYRVTMGISVTHLKLRQTHQPQC